MAGSRREEEEDKTLQEMEKQELKENALLCSILTTQVPFSTVAHLQNMINPRRKTKATGKPNFVQFSKALSVMKEKSKHHTMESFLLLYLQLHDIAVAPSCLDLIARNQTSKIPSSTLLT